MSTSPTHHHIIDDGLDLVTIPRDWLQQRALERVATTTRSTTYRSSVLPAGSEYLSEHNADFDDDDDYFDTHDELIVKDIGEFLVPRQPTNDRLTFEVKHPLVWELDSALECVCPDTLGLWLVGRGQWGHPKPLTQPLHGTPIGWHHDETIDSFIHYTSSLYPNLQNEQPERWANIEVLDQQWKQRERERGECWSLWSPLLDDRFLGNLGASRVMARTSRESLWMLILTDTRFWG